MPKRKLKRRKKREKLKRWVIMCESGRVFIVYARHSGHALEVVHTAFPAEQPTAWEQENIEDAQVRIIE